jgi:hypothetical protein
MLPLSLEKNLEAIYARHAQTLEEYAREALCRPGCAFCCTDVGAVDASTLEAARIRHRLLSMPGKEQKHVARALAENRKTLMQKGIARCAFLNAENLCHIYDIRPFSCRGLYSERECKGNGAAMRRGARDLAGQTFRQIQALDSPGYSGHIAHLLLLLDDADFRKTYLSGAFHPERIHVFGKAHGLVINRVVSPSAPVTP